MVSLGRLLFSASFLKAMIAAAALAPTPVRVSKTACEHVHILIYMSVQILNKYSYKNGNKGMHK